MRNVSEDFKRNVYKMDNPKSMPNVYTIDVYTEAGNTVEFTINADNLIDVKYTQTIGSGDSIKFGSAMSKIIELQYFDHISITGRKIDVYYTAFNQRMTVGTFICDKCAIDDVTEIYTATCYDLTGIGILDSNVAALLLDSYADASQNRSVFSVLEAVTRNIPAYIGSNYSLSSSDYTVTNETYQSNLTRVFNADGTFSHHIYVNYVVQKITHNRPDLLINVKPRRNIVMDRVNNMTKSLEGYILVAGSDGQEVFAPANTPNNYYLGGDMYLYSNTPTPSTKNYPLCTHSSGSAHTKGANYIWVRIPVSITTSPVTSFNTIVAQYTAVYGDTNYWVDNLGVLTPQKVNNIKFDYTTLTSINEVTIRKFLTAYAELQATFIYADNNNEISYGNYRLERHFGLTPALDRYPSTTLYPSNTSYAESGTQAIRSDKIGSIKVGLKKRLKNVIINYKDTSGNDAQYIYQVNANGNWDYEISDNFILANAKLSEGDVHDYIATNFDLVADYYPVEFEAIGMPWHQLLDPILVQTNDSDVFTFIMEKTLNGMLCPIDVIKAV